MGAHKRLKWQLKSLHGSVLGPLHICYDCWLGIWGDSWQWEWGCLWLFCLLLESLSSYWVALYSLDMRVCAWYYCILLCHVWVMSLGDLLFSVWRQGWGRGSGRESRSRRSGGTGKCGQDILYEKRISKQIGIYYSINIYSTNILCNMFNF